MKSTCIKCKRDYDEVEMCQYIESLDSVDEDRYSESMLCPECFEELRC